MINRTAPSVHRLHTLALESRGGGGGEGGGSMYRGYAGRHTYYKVYSMYTGVRYTTIHTSKSPKLVPHDKNLPADGYRLYRHPSRGVAREGGCVINVCWIQLADPSFPFSLPSAIDIVKILY